MTNSIAKYQYQLGMLKLLPLHHLKHTPLQKKNQCIGLSFALYLLESVQSIIEFALAVESQ